MKKFVGMVVAILLNKFDCFIVVEGNRGLGKSTLAYRILKRVAREMKHRGVDDYRFNPRIALIYTRKEVIKFFHKWKCSGIGDELINVTFNRDFYDEDQKDLIKMINMNRDHGNLFVGCVPKFQTLDSQIKGLCKIRLTVVRRGLAIIQTPNRIIYSKDNWDSATNEKIEKDWIKKKISQPHYAKLTTFRGIIKFPKLSDKEEDQYQSIKNEKRNIVAKEQMGINVEELEKDPIMDALKRLEEGKIRNAQVLEGMAYASDKDPDTFKRAIIVKLKRQGKPHKLVDYYWETKRKRGAVITEEGENLSNLISKITGGSDQS
jgi:hypothetical protein